MTLSENTPGERRVYPRIRALYLVSYTTDSDGREKISTNIGRTLDISSSGTRLEVYEQIAEGARVEVEIDIQEKIIAARGKCVHTHESDAGVFVIGIEFDRLHHELVALLGSSDQP